MRVKARYTLYRIEKEGKAAPKQRGPKHKITDNIDDFGRRVIRRTINQSDVWKQTMTNSFIYFEQNQTANWIYWLRIYSQSVIESHGLYKYKKRSTMQFLKESHHRQTARIFD